MSWNPRRMAAATTADTELVRMGALLMWATPDTIDRLLAAPPGDSPDLSTLAVVPERGVLLGLGRPLLLPTADRAAPPVPVSAIGLLLLPVAATYFEMWQAGDIPTGRSEQLFPLVLMDQRLDPVGAALIPALVTVSEGGDVGISLAWEVAAEQESRTIPSSVALSTEGANMAVDLFFSAWEMFSDPQAASDSALDITSDEVPVERKRSKRASGRRSAVGLPSW